MQVIWLALTWLALIALWGSSERWDLRAIARRGQRLDEELPDDADPAPFDWAGRW